MSETPKSLRTSGPEAGPGDIAECLSAWRRVRQITDEDLAQRLAATPAHVADLLAGRVDARAPELAIIVGVLLDGSEAELDMTPPGFSEAPAGLRGSVEDTGAGVGSQSAYAEFGDELQMARAFARVSNEADRHFLIRLCELMAQR